ncbi:hypothetical protein E2C01_090952 [Portunus trituberculatus]|uniref:Uncharacterized protein n=1 Tax=Portunus trituberculatus TaxID=210409 RepID=A0A5B7JRH7_PORTR|nr:hypothetical protein [Portunus trituberculatus]
MQVKRREHLRKQKRGGKGRRGRKKRRSGGGQEESEVEPIGAKVFKDFVTLLSPRLTMEPVSHRA